MEEIHQSAGDVDMLGFFTWLDNYSYKFKLNKRLREISNSGIIRSKDSGTAELTICGISEQSLHTGMVERPEVAPH